MRRTIRVIIGFAFVLSTCHALQPASFGRWPAPWPDASDWPDDTGWLKTLEQLYYKTVDQVGFCFGSSPHGLQRLLQASFAWPLPSGPVDDATCSNVTRIGAALCGPEDIAVYYKFMLLTEDPEKVPNTEACPAGQASSMACAPGFFNAAPPALARNSTSKGRKPKPHACCPGYFCPANLACMMPCPQGAYCPRAAPALPPKAYRPGLGRRSHWCAPYAYKEREAYGCGGADRWTVIPSTAFPTQHWAAGSGSLYCD